MFCIFVRTLIKAIDMKKVFKIGLIITLFLLQSCSIHKSTEAQQLTHFFNKEEVTIVVTDSGLGGISVAADLENRIREKGTFKQVNIVFFNALLANNKGYNSMKTTKEKVTVFNSALNAMDKKIKPDLVLIACNTLSVLYDKTAFSKNVKIPVVGVVDSGVELINNNLKGINDSKVLIFATKTTVNQQSHKNKLLKLGISDKQIITQACPSLAGKIELNPNGKETKYLVKKYVEESIQKIDKKDKNLFVSYNCTHYPYIDTLFKEAFKKQNITINKFLNPNPLMVDFIFDKKYANRYKKTNTSVEVISQAKLLPDEIKSISNLIRIDSDKTSKALENYSLKTQLFRPY